MGKDRQPGFYSAENGSALHSRPQKGDVMIKPKESKRRHRGPTPYAEAMEYQQALKNRADGAGIWVGETLDGGEIIVEKSPKGDFVSLIGEAEDNWGVEEGIKWQAPVQAPLPEISDKGKKLWHVLRKKE